MQRYLTHGLVVVSQLEMPELTAGKSDLASDLHVVESDQVASVPSDYGFERSADDFSVWWSLVGKFTIANSGDVSLSRLPDVPDSVLRLPLVGCILAVAAIMKGRFLLHANALNVGGKAVFLMGKKGQGKSTLTAGLLGRGHTLLSDDASALTIEANSDLVAHRGCLQMKLWPDSIAQWAGHSAADHRQIHIHCEKRIVDAMSYASPQDRIPLGGIYILDEGPAIEARLLSPAEAWPQVFAQSYAAIFGERFFNPASKLDHFAKCTQLARSARVMHLRRPKRFDQIGAVAELIEKDIASSRG